MLFTHWCGFLECFFIFHTCFCWPARIQARFPPLTCVPGVSHVPGFHSGSPFMQMITNRPDAPLYHSTLLPGLLQLHFLYTLPFSQFYDLFFVIFVVLVLLTHSKLMASMLQSLPFCSQSSLPKMQANVGPINKIHSFCIRSITELEEQSDSRLQGCADWLLLRCRWRTLPTGQDWTCPIPSHTFLFCYVSACSFFLASFLVFPESVPSFQTSRTDFSTTKPSTWSRLRSHNISVLKVPLIINYPAHTVYMCKRGKVRAAQIIN